MLGSLLEIWVDYETKIQNTKIKQNQQKWGFNLENPEGKNQPSRILELTFGEIRPS